MTHDPMAHDQRQTEPERPEPNLADLNTNRPDVADDPRVLEVIEEYERDLQAGRRPDRRLYVGQYPELAVTIAECIDGLELLYASSPKKNPLRDTLNISPSSHGAEFAAPLPRPAAESFAAHATQPLDQSQSLGDFQIVGVIARGGMGVVYEAVQLSLGRRVALKVLPFAATVDPRQLQRFKLEAQAAALLHHTHIVPIYAVGCERGVHFYAMQLIEGQSLATVIDQLRKQEGRGETGDPAAKANPSAVLDETQHQRFARTAPPAANQHCTAVDVSATLTAGNAVSSLNYIRRVSQLIIQAAKALEHAHRAGVVHRDIKPANLLLDAVGNLWVTDFGLAQLQTVENGLTRSGDMLGTFRYMSPEQSSGQRAVLDHRTDIYSLGATFYELLTLEPVFNANSHQELFYHILHVEPRSPRHWNHTIPPELETIILKSLSKLPAERYAAAVDFAADIQRYLEHQPILARRPSLVDRTRKWSRRHPSLAAAGVLLLLVLVVASLVSNRLISAEQQKTVQALNNEKLRAQEAEERFQQARQAVDALFQISEEELTDRPTEGARKRILQIVLSYYEGFIEQRRGDVASQAELARVQDKVKSILYELTMIPRDMQLRLLENDEVLEDLEVTQQQRSRLNFLLSQWADERHETLPWIRLLSDQARRSHIVDQAELHEQALAQLFTAAQQRRFRQIAIQSQGLLAFRDPEVIQTLDLTTQQRQEIRELERELFANGFRPRMPGEWDKSPPPPPPPDWQRSDRPPRGAVPDAEPGDGPDRHGPGRGGDDAGMQEFGHFGHPQREPLPSVQTAVEEALELLTPEQRQRWRELIGKPLDGSFDAPPFPGPPRHPA